MRLEAIQHLLKQNYCVFCFVLLSYCFLGACSTTKNYDNQLVDRDRFIHSRGGLEKIDPSSLSDRMLCLIAVNPFDRTIWASGLNDPDGKFKAEAIKRGLCIRD